MGTESDLMRRTSPPAIRSWKRENLCHYTTREALKHFRIVNRGNNLPFLTNAGPCGVRFHHAFHYPEIVPLLDVSIFEEAVRQDHRAAFRPDANG